MNKLGKFVAGVGVGAVTGGGLYIALSQHNSELFTQSRDTIESFHRLFVQSDYRKDVFQHYYDEVCYYCQSTLSLLQEEE